MATIRYVASVLFVAMMALGAVGVPGQDYPSKPIRIFSGGGSADLIARLMSPVLADRLGQPVIVENRVAALQREAVGNAPPDGYSLMLAGNSFWIAPLLQKVNYDPGDFSPVTLVTSSPNILVVHPSLPVKSVKELIALAKAKPGQLNYASTSLGSAAHLAGELFKSMAGVNIVHIPYNGSGPAMTNIISGEVQLVFPAAGAAVSLVKSGRLRALAVTSSQPTALAPGLPTLAATLPGYESVVMNGMFVRAKTPAAIVSRLNQEIVRVLNQPDIKAKSFDAGVDLVGNLPEELAAKVKSEVTIMGKVIKEAGIRIE